MAIVETFEDPAEFADAAGLVYVTDQLPGIRRRRRGRGFSYTTSDGGTVDAGMRERISALAIPPAWTDVWICPDPKGHLQATGRDVRGRKQYRYHDEWRRVRDGHKFERLAEFGAALGPLRKEVDDRMRGRRPDRDTVLAAVVWLLDETLIRVGSPEYAQDNETFGLTTLRDDHAELGQRRVAFDFIGKSGTRHEVTVADPRLARIVRRCHELGGKELFTFAGPDGDPVPITSADVNEHLRLLTGLACVSAKDFRTWGGTVTAVEVLGERGPAGTEREAEEAILAAIDSAAECLHNTRAVCRASYVHPAVPEAYREGRLADVWRGARSSPWYSRAEQATCRLLDRDG